MARMTTLCIGSLLVITPLRAAVFLVINTNDAGAGSLRSAITSANATPGADTIQFAIPGPGVHTIFPLSQLPALTDPTGVIIDGYTQPGSSPGLNPPATAVIFIELDGGLAGASHGLVIQSPVNLIQGLAVNNFEQDGIRIQAMPAPTIGNHIVANFIGTTPAGTAAKGNGRNHLSYWAGVDIQGTAGVPGQALDNWIQNNLISGNYAEGIAIASLANNNVAFNHVEPHNYIGTDLTGAVDLGNVHDGVYIGEGAHDNIVALNVISGNDFEGVCIIGYHEPPAIYTDANIVGDNIIGLDIGLNPLPNTWDGVSIGRYGSIYSGGHARHNLVQHNTIARNTMNGVTVWEHPISNNNADGNTISENSIYDNAMLGIDLGINGVTANDVGDLDAGANQEVNFPLIAQAVYCAGYTAISGTVMIDTNPALATVEVFKAIPDPSGFGEGAVFVGAATPDAFGSWSLAVAFQLRAADAVTATTTDTNGNTSEFNPIFTVVAQNGCGDLNGDSLTDAADLLLLARYLNGSTGTIAAAADFNFDGVIDGTDLALLRNVVAGNL